MYSLLIVDDDKATVLLLKQIIVNKFDSSISVFVANNGKEAIDVCLINDIDIIISDINMPKMGGLELLKEIKDKRSDIYFILMSSNLSHSNLEESVQYDVDRILPKSSNNKILISVIKKHIDNLDSHKKSISSIKLLDEYREIIDISSIVTKTNTKGIITYVNDAFCKISGYCREELIGKNHNIVRDETMKSSTFSDLWKTIKNKKIWKGEIKNKNRSGSIYTVLATISPILNNYGEIEEYISVRHDITNEVRLREFMLKQIEEKDICITANKEEIFDTQREMILTLGQVAETRSQETGQHVKRVSEYSYLLACLYGLSSNDANTLRTVSPMHDVGKVGISDSILNKPSKLTTSEFTLMKKHATIGFEMLNKSNRPLIKAAAIIAHEHHEKWNGEGYPNSKKGEEIHIFARITAVADVFDALGHDRVYKKAWHIDDILNLLKEEKGKHFDPILIDLFLDNLNLFLDLKNKLDD